MTAEAADPRRLCVLEDREAVYLVVSKVACTSIKTALGRAYGVRPEVPHAIHGRDHFHYCYGELPERYRGFFLFAFVRNPFDRLVSCYRDKVLFEDGNELYPRPYFRDHDYEVPPNVDFPRFARIVAAVPDHRADRHFMSQHAILHQDGRLLPEFVGRFESLESDWRAVARRLGLDGSLPHLHRSDKKPGAERDFRSYYRDREVVELVRRRYLADVETFGYQSAYEELLDGCESAAGAASNA